MKKLFKIANKFQSSLLYVVKFTAEDKVKHEICTSSEEAREVFELIMNDFNQYVPTADQLITIKEGYASTATGARIDAS